MNTQRAVYCLLLIYSLATARAEDNTPLQSQASFEAAVRNYSASPSYVSITVVDDMSGKTWSGCTIASLLEGAIHREYNLGYDTQGMKKAEEILLKSKDRVFHFSKPSALENIPFSFSKEDLEEVRKKLSEFNVQQLREGFSAHGKLHSLYRVEPWKRRSALRDAVACALIERGLSPGIADLTGQIWIAP